MDTFLSKNKYLTCDESVEKWISQLNTDEFYLTCGGKVISDVPSFLSDNQSNFVTFYVHLKLRGGKGGFGSMLRSFRVNRSTNQLMCRDLNGRRVATVEEEKKIRLWLQKAAEREKKKFDKKKAKVEKLKKGTGKHQFDDVDYMRQKEDILEKTEEAFEHGFEHFKKRRAEELNASSSDSDLDLDEYGQPLRKKKKSEELDHRDVEESSDSENECDPELIKEIKDYFNSKPIEAESSSQLEAMIKEEINEPKKEKSDTPIIYEDIDLSSITSPDDLVRFGLEHLKEALKIRGLKCGGTLQERADRLFSVRDLKPSDYPKNILASKK